jgi:hypothetical protein
MDYQMFTEDGNAAVDEIVEQAREKGLDWYATLKLLTQLSRVEGGIYEECMDTAVREAVFTALKFDQTEQEFYL